MRVVLDTNCVIAGIFWRGSARAILDLARAKRIKIYTSATLAGELASALSKPKFALPLRQASLSANGIVADYLRVAHFIKRPQAIQPLSRDPSDDEVLACARAAQADLIVSGDKDLLVLQRYAHTPIVTTSVGLAIMKSTIGP